MSGTSPPTQAQNDWVRRVLGIEPAEDGLSERLLDARNDMHPLLTSADPAVSGLRTLLKAAGDAVAEHAADRERKIEELEAEISRAKQAARVREANSVKISQVFRSLQVQWRDAQRRAEESLKSLGDDLLSRDEVQEDPRIEEVEALVDRLSGLLPSLGGKLNDQLDDLANAGDRDPALLKTVQATLVDYRKQLDDVPELEELEKFASSELGGSFPVYSSLIAVLGQLDGALPKAA